MPDESSKSLSPGDPNSFSRPDEAKVVDVFLQLEINFEKKILHGAVTLTVERKLESPTHLVLDSRDLNVTKAINEETGELLDFKLGPKGYVGSKLEIRLPNKNSRTNIKIEYSTSEASTALQWLPKEQTAGKTHPYLFSQCQAIHCRSMIPCQDTPSVKTPYSAEMTAPKDFTVLMSGIMQGDPQEKDGKKTYKFYQKVPIQSYLIAIAAGRLESRRIGPRSHVWSEIEYVEKAAYEFSDTEIMLQKAEELCGPYVWGIYDILVLPPSFPYGGMENPCLTFATPTLLAGDRSLAGVIAHEIAHSWTGNLVTNKNFEHFWLNEGFTVFTERKIKGLMENGEASRSFSAIGGWKSLKYGIETQGETNPLTALVVNLDGVDPDDAFSVVPYEKGSTFLWYLEDTVGGPGAFEPFLRAYYENFKYQSIDSYQFKEFFLNYFKNNDLSSINWDQWFNLPGMPKYKPNFDESLAKVCSKLREDWVKWIESEPCPFTSSDLENFSSGQKIEFLGQLLEENPISTEKVRKMQDVYNFNAVNNSEIKFRWIRLGLRSKWEDAIPLAIQMVSEQGRMKFLRPIYRDLYSWEDKRDIAIETFNANKNGYMHVAAQGLEKDLKLA
jgi:leukotriene-A4 hydrolase